MLTARYAILDICMALKFNFFSANLIAYLRKFVAYLELSWQQHEVRKRALECGFVFEPEWFTMMRVIDEIVERSFEMAGLDLSLNGVLSCMSSAKLIMDEGLNY